ncbi:MAG: MFS transporter [Acidimicrobiales bacterium]
MHLGEQRGIAPSRRQLAQPAHGEDQAEMVTVLTEGGDQTAQAHGRRIDVAPDEVGRSLGEAGMTEADGRTGVGKMPSCLCDPSGGRGVAAISRGEGECEADLAQPRGIAQGAFERQRACGVTLILGYSPLHSAVCLLPLGMIVMPMSRLAPHLVERLGQRAVMSMGLVSLAAGLGILSCLDGDSTYWHFLTGLVVVGFGMAFTSTPATTAIVTSPPRAKQGIGSAVNDLSRELGSALGIAILGSLFNARYRDAIGDSTAGLPPEAAHHVEESAGAGLAIAAKMGPSGEQLAERTRDAFAAGLGNALTAGALIALLAAGFTLWRAPRCSPSMPEPVLDGLDEARELDAVMASMHTPEAVMTS